MTQRIAIYARYSSDLQRDASIEDQLRLCEGRAKAEGWQIVNCYSDAAISGSSMMLRSGMQNLLQDALSGKFDIVLAESLDRLSRNLHDISGLHKQFEFAGVKIFTLSEGEITTMHVGLKGTMSELFLKDLGDKTWRGQSGRAAKGKFPGGISYGYRVKKQFDAHGEAIKGEREIDEAQADIIRRIFREYANDNKSPKAIAAQLNEENVPCPSGKSWGQSTINGNRKRGSGVLNNELYIGQLVWNRLKMVKDPSTGKRLSRVNDESEWIRVQVPELRIVSDELWNAVKARQKALDRTKPGLWRTNRPQYLLSGLVKCGSCGGGYAKINSTHYGCSASKNKGEAVCANRKTIKRETLENLVLDGLQQHLMQDELLAVFCEEYTKHLNMLHKNKNAAQAQNRSELTKLEKERQNLIQAIKDGVPASMIKVDLERVTQRQEEVEKLIKDTPAPKPLLHPAMASRYHQSIKELRHQLSEGKANNQAAEHIRALIEKIVLTPKEGQKELSIDLYGDLAGILNLATENKDMKEDKKLAWLQLLPANDNSDEAKQDSVGSGGRI